MRSFALALLLACAVPAWAQEQVVIHVYTGWGTPTRVEVSGRVLRAEPGDAGKPAKGQGALENLIANISALESDEVEQSAVTVTLGAAVQQVKADEEVKAERSEALTDANSSAVAGGQSSLGYNR